MRIMACQAFFFDNPRIIDKSFAFTMTDQADFIANAGHEIRIDRPMRIVAGNTGLPGNRSMNEPGAADLAVTSAVCAVIYRVDTPGKICLAAFRDIVTTGTVIGQINVGMNKILEILLGRYGIFHGAVKKVQRSGINDLFLAGHGFDDIKAWLQLDPRGKNPLGYLDAGPLDIFAASQPNYDLIDRRLGISNQSDFGIGHKDIIVRKNKMQILSGRIGCRNSNDHQSRQNCLNDCMFQLHNKGVMPIV